MQQTEPKGNVSISRLMRIRAWVRRRVLWSDWQADRSKYLLLIHPKEKYAALSVKYTTTRPGIYRVKLSPDIARRIGTDLSDPNSCWMAQFGRRRTAVLSLTSIKGSQPCYDLHVDMNTSRSLRLSPDGVLAKAVPDALPTAQTAQALYAEVAAAWRQLTDVRFKLLAFLPLVTGVGLFQLLNTNSAFSSAPRWARATAAAFGLVITVALFIYERRNSELYDDLISRGRHLEKDLGAESGVFLGRLQGRTPVNHGVALFTIYGATLAAWLLVLIAVSTGALDSTPAPSSTLIPQNDSSITPSTSLPDSATPTTVD
jgi:hypothetical protein